MNDHNYEQPKAESAEKPFVPPRHWIGPEELQASYWMDASTQEKRSQEFYEKPVEWIEKVDQIDKKGLARRDFLTIMGASMAMASFACARRPVHKIIPYVIKPEEVTPGVANWYASTCNECSSCCGVLVKNREGRPVKLEGNPDHPMSQGKLCAQGQASILNLYDPDRLKAPIARSRLGLSRKEMTWNEADLAIQSKLKEIFSRSGQVSVLSGEIQSPSSSRLIREFLSPFKGTHVEFEPLQLDEIAEAQELSYGASLVPHYHFEKAERILSLGADFLGTWGFPVEYSRTWSKGRKLQNQEAKHARLSQLICFESHLTLTGSNADERYAVRPGDELKVALALAHEWVVKRKLSRFANDTAVSVALSGYSIEAVAQDIGIENGNSQLRKIANELWESRGKSLVIGGGLSSRTSHALALQVAVNLLNSLLENEGVTVDGVVSWTPARTRFLGFLRLVEEMKAGKIDALIIYRSNPVYTASLKALGFSEALKRVPLVVLVSDREDETGLLSDFVVPDHHYLESWGDSSPRQGLYSLQQPTVAPLHSTRSFQDSLLTWNKALGAGSSDRLISRAEDWHGYLQNNWRETLFKESGNAGSFEQFWEGVLRSGVFNLAAAQGKSLKPSPRPFQISSLAQLPKYSGGDSQKISLALYAKVSMADGRSANNAWLQELPDPISSVAWDNYLNVGPRLAKKLDVKENDVVELSTEYGLVRIPVHIQPGIHSQVVSVAVGYGRHAAGKVGNKTGVDIFPLTQITDRRWIFSGQTVQIRKTSEFYSLASTQWHTATEHRPIINDITLDEYRKNPAAAAHTDPHLRLDPVPTLWPLHEYKGHRWGMAIDLNSCTGCGACVIACQAENNIPVVGRDQVRVSRQMHWIRVDRYYAGSPENPDVIFQPMLCQHCENAPCETVCPVLATVHDDEGLNLQVYNRCVGTRYCQNNCPYKVRRFNFFDHWKAYEGPMNMAWNPDVTVRTRGIMEKCTFCTQRIRDAKDKAKDAGEKVLDGDFQTACQQTCASDAIVFGDINDPQSRVSKMNQSPQAFRVLEVLNTRPAISYMTKVRNKAGGAHHVGGASEHA